MPRARRQLTHDETETVVEISHAISNSLGATVKVLLERGFSRDTIVKKLEAAIVVIKKPRKPVVARKGQDPASIITAKIKALGWTRVKRTKARIIDGVEFRAYFAGTGLIAWVAEHPDKWCHVAPMFKRACYLAGVDGRIIGRRYRSAEGAMAGIAKALKAHM
jgi:hypothetical protein